ncbi:hypothetical protein VaNZ11_015519, partial [Volvox africanus]
MFAETNVAHSLALTPSGKKFVPVIATAAMETYNVIGSDRHLIGVDMNSENNDKMDYDNSSSAVLPGIPSGAQTDACEPIPASCSSNASASMPLSTFSVTAQSLRLGASSLCRLGVHSVRSGSQHLLGSPDHLPSQMMLHAYPYTHHPHDFPCCSPPRVLHQLSVSPLLYRPHAGIPVHITNCSRCCYGPITECDDGGGVGTGKGAARDIGADHTGSFALRNRFGKDAVILVEDLSPRVCFPVITPGGGRHEVVQATATAMSVAASDCDGTSAPTAAAAAVVADTARNFGVRLPHEKSLAAEAVANAAPPVAVAVIPGPLPSRADAIASIHLGVAAMAEKKESGGEERAAEAATPYHGAFAAAATAATAATSNPIAPPITAAIMADVTEMAEIAASSKCGYQFLGDGAEPSPESQTRLLPSGFPLRVLHPTAL